MEKAATGESEAAIVERCLLKCLRSPRQLKLICEYAQKDPTISAMLDAFNASRGGD